MQAELVVLGGAFFVNGNVNPAAEANIFGDPEAADFVLGLCPRCLIVGLDVTHKVDMNDARFILYSDVLCCEIDLQSCPPVPKCPAHGAADSSVGHVVATQSEGHLAAGFRIQVVHVTHERARMRNNPFAEPTWASDSLRWYFQTESNGPVCD